MLVNSVEAELILYHIDAEATFNHINHKLLRVIITEEEDDVFFSPDELWWILRGVPVEGNAADIYHGIKVKAAKSLLEHYQMQPSKTPAERADDQENVEKLAEEIYARQDEGDAEGDTEDGTGEARGTEPGRVLSESEDEDSEGDRPSDSLGCQHCDRQTCWDEQEDGTGNCQCKESE